MRWQSDGAAYEAHTGCYCTCLHLSSAPFLSPSACSARSIAFSLSSFSICIFFLIASMFLELVFSQLKEKCVRLSGQRQAPVCGGADVDKSARSGLCKLLAGLEDGLAAARAHTVLFFLRRGPALGYCPYLGSESWPVCACRVSSSRVITSALYTSISPHSHVSALHLGHLHSHLTHISVEH